MAPLGRKRPVVELTERFLNWRETERERRIRTAYLRQSETALPPQWRVLRKQGLPGRYSLRRFSLRIHCGDRCDYKYFKASISVVPLFTQRDVDGISPRVLVFALHADHPRS